MSSDPFFASALDTEGKGSRRGFDRLAKVLSYELMAVVTVHSWKSKEEPWMDQAENIPLPMSSRNMIRGCICFSESLLSIRKISHLNLI